MSQITTRRAELGTCFFYASRLRFRALWRSSSRWRFRALFWALNFALLRSRFCAPALLDFSPSFFALLDFLRFFSRSSIFRARTFAIIDFRAPNFVLVRLYTARIGQPGQDTQNKTARTAEMEQNRQNRAGRTRQAEHYRQKKTGRIGQAEQDGQNRTGSTGKAEQDRENRTGRTGQPEQGSQKGTGRTRMP